MNYFALTLLTYKYNTIKNRGFWHALKKEFTDFFLANFENIFKIEIEIQSKQERPIKAKQKIKKEIE